MSKTYVSRVSKECYTKTLPEKTQWDKKFGQMRNDVRIHT